MGTIHLSVWSGSTAACLGPLGNQMQSSYNKPQPREPFFYLAYQSPTNLDTILHVFKMENYCLNIGLHTFALFYPLPLS